MSAAEASGLVLAYAIGCGLGLLVIWDIYLWVVPALAARPARRAEEARRAEAIRRAEENRRYWAAAADAALVYATPRPRPLDVMGDERMRLAAQRAEAVVGPCPVCGHDPARSAR